MASQFKDNPVKTADDVALCFPAPTSRPQKTEEKCDLSFKNSLALLKMSQTATLILTHLSPPYHSNFCASLCHYFLFDRRIRLCRMIARFYSDQIPEVTELHTIFYHVSHTLNSRGVLVSPKQRRNHQCRRAQ